jgi:crotonobetaine/carnitine-CoA ligase
MSRAYGGEWVVSALVEDRAERFGERVAVEAAGERITYGELADRAARVAGALAALGVAPGDRVATMLPSSPDYLAAWFGVAWAGAVDVPVNTDLKGELLAHVLRESEARLMVLDARWLERLEGLELPDLARLVVVGPAPEVGPGGRPATPLAAALAHDPAPRVPRRESDLVYVMYTSGTTGPSKGVMHANRSALWNVRSWIDILELTEGDVAHSMFPLFHVTARSAVVTSTIWAGGRIALRDGFSPARFWDDVRASGATFFAYMGAVIQLLWAQDERSDDADNALRVAFGAAAPPAILEAFERRFGVELLEVYGSTELGPATAPRPGGRRRLGTMGWSCPHVTLEIHDPDDDPLPPGAAGEICARPAVPYGIFQGYWRRPEETLRAFRNLWFHTGDAGRLDDDGFLTFTDRLKDSLRRRGENISSFEVERAVQAHPDVAECAAYAVPSELTEDEVMVAVVPRAGRTLDLDGLVAFCVETMPRFMVPRYLRVVDALPKTPSQRVQKFRLREQGVTPDTLDREALGVVLPRS